MIVSYVVEQPFLEYAEGDIVQLEEDQAAPFIEAGILAPATQDHLDEGDEGDDTEEDVVEEEAPEFVANAAKNLEKKFTEAVESATKKVSEKFVRDQREKAKVVLPAVARDTKEETTFGFKSIGEFAKCVVKKEHNHVESARRLEMAAKKFGSSIRMKSEMGTGGGPTVTASDGGYLIPPAYAAQLFSKVQNVTSLKDFCQDEPFTGNTLEVPVDTTSSYASGVTVAWTTEASAITDSTLPLNMVEIKLKALAALVNVTEYLLDDNNYSLDNYLQNHVPTKMIAALNNSILYGNGSGANVVNNAATVTVTRNTSSQIKFEDVSAMYARMAQDNLPNAKWYISPSNIGSLFGLSFPTSGIPVFLPTGTPGGYPSLGYQVVGSLLGKEVVLCEQMQALGYQGDFLFADLSAVSKIEKNLDAKATPYLYFNKAINTFRFIVRMGTASRWLTPWTRQDNVTASPFVKLSGSSTVVPS